MQAAEVIELYYQNRDAQRAAAMAAYMKDLFPYLGIAKPVRAFLSGHQLQPLSVREASKYL